MSGGTLADALARLADRAATEGALVALDFDGTLAPLVDDPAASRPVPSAAAVLARLADRPGVALALVSGRAVTDLGTLAAPPPGTHLVGSHGAERGRWTPDGLERTDLHLDADAAATLAELTSGLTALVDGTTGRVEHKPASVVLHTRTATPEDAARLTDAALALGDRPGVDVLHGKAVVELSVLDVTKGTALAALRDELGVGPVLYAGDDVTDERAFRTLADGDLTVKVGDGETAARWRVADPEELVAALGVLADHLAPGRS